MKFIRGLVLGAVLGCIVGAGLGINFGQGHPLMSNPVASKAIRDKVVSGWLDLLRYGSDAVGDVIANRSET